MNTEQFEYLRGFLKKQSGLVLGDDKRYLIDSRLMPVAKEFGHKDVAELVDAMRRPGSMRLAERVTEAMTINESFFYRDVKPFQHFREIMLPHMQKERAGLRKLRIWSAAASTGQEAYSLAIELTEKKARLAGWRYDIIGTDLSNEVLERARIGKYSQFEVQRGMPSNLLMKYFQQQGGEWHIKPEIKSMVQFRHFNLLSDYRQLGQFDIVFCRNVLIYFDRETKADILRRMAAQMAPDAFLVLGAAETIVGLSNDFQMVAGVRGLYHKAGASLSASKPGGPGATGSAAAKRAPTPAGAAATAATAAKSPATSLKQTAEQVSAISQMLANSRSR